MEKLKKKERKIDINNLNGNSNFKRKSNIKKNDKNKKMNLAPNVNLSNLNISQADKDTPKFSLEKPKFINLGSYDIESDDEEENEKIAEKKYKQKIPLKKNKENSNKIKNEKIEIKNLDDYLDSNKKNGLIYESFISSESIEENDNPISNYQNIEKNSSKNIKHESISIDEYHCLEESEPDYTFDEAQTKNQKIDKNSLSKFFNKNIASLVNRLSDSLLHANDDLENILNKLDNQSLDENYKEIIEDEVKKEISGILSKDNCKAFEDLKKLNDSINESDSNKSNKNEQFSINTITKILIKNIFKIKRRKISNKRSMKKKRLFMKVDNQDFDNVDIDNNILEDL